ncbi:hypothetical protein PX52LOC_04646 [Limnoglobus roseus]|uniref:Uncharacterized protein n=1 Tax=Limnoglobus roseus TaxID=2598579 RepID=A0A5C1AL70_9BACT|nr:hypothetical protein PX52LOC_04646 [Limnoglobus roseus]
MTAIHRIDPEIWVETPKGGGLAYFLIDYGPSINTIWVVRLDATGDVIHVESSEVRILGNPMWHIPHPLPFDPLEPPSANGAATLNRIKVHEE